MVLQSTPANADEVDTRRFCMMTNKEKEGETIE
jgi:hypothetical protein